MKCKHVIIYFFCNIASTSVTEEVIDEALRQCLDDTSGIALVTAAETQGKLVDLKKYPFIVHLNT